jgi:fibronectin type 3 domain-containing protein
MAGRVLWHRWILPGLTIVLLTGCPDLFGTDDTDRDTTPPAPVTELVATAGNGEVLLSWTDPEDGDLDHIEIRWSPGDEDPVTVDAGEEGHRITGLANGTPYTFLLVSVDNAGNRSDAADVSATPQIDGATDDDTDADDTDDPDPTDSEWTIGDIGSSIFWTEDTAPELSWDAVEGAASYEVQLADIEATIETGRIRNAESTSLQVEESLGNAAEYRWRVRAVDSDGRRSVWSETYALEIDWNTQITGIRARDDDEISIHWNDLTGAAAYEIQVTRNEAFLENALIRTIDESQYVYDGTLSEGQELYWRIRAIDRVGYVGAWSGIGVLSESLTPREGLLAEYLFSGDATDTSGNGNDGTVNGATLTVDRFGNSESAYSFDGSGDYIGAISTGQNDYDSFTISFWAEWNGQNRVMPIGTHNSDGSTSGYVYFYNDSVYVNFEGDGEYYNANNALKANEWAHYAITNDGDGVLRIYVDGIEVDSASRQYTVHDSYRIGWSYSDYYFGGKIDDVRIYDRPLTEDEIAILTGEGGYVAPVHGLTASVGDERIDLSWTNPAPGTFDRVVVVRSLTGGLETPSDGTVVFSGTETSYTDTDVVNETQYYYAVFAVDTSGAHSRPVVTAATPQETVLFNFEEGTIPDVFSGDWIISSNAYSGDYAMENRNIGDSQSSAVEYAVIMPSSGSFEVSFLYSTSTEGGWDFLRFDVDGTEQNRWSGSNSWSQHTHTVSGTPGDTVTLRWRYTKDGSVSSGSDTVWIDQIEIAW